MEVRLASEHSTFVHELKAGRFENPEAVIAEALCRMERDEAKLIRLRAEIGVGIQAAERGDFVPFDVDEIIAEVIAENS